ncbi:MAG: alpha/beta hydrolase [Zoogloeaceae bacterium]|jgi:pimeloyl-ACP methyl ester carboxylesterase|nr:alpha/beta hydrolase [Zoogloeaceae bacterium]
MKIDVNGKAVFLYTGGKAMDAGALKAAVAADTPVVLFLHGAQLDHSCWLLQSRWFGHHGFLALAPDLPGHGKSAGEALSSIEALADWVVALLEALEIPQANVVGHSMGSLITLECAARHPQHFKRAVFVGTAIPMPVAPVLLNAARDDEAKAAQMINAWSYGYGQIGGSPVPGMWLLGQNLRLMARQPRGTFHRDLSACNAYARTVESLADIRLPTLFVTGGQDRMTAPKIARAMRETIPGAREIILPGSGHALMAEYPDAVLDALREFFSEP